MFTFNMGDLLSKAEAERRKDKATRRREAVRPVKTYLNELMDGSRSYLQLSDAIAYYGEIEATRS
jgi:hypothetical protein